MGMRELTLVMEKNSNSANRGDAGESNRKRVVVPSSRGNKNKARTTSRTTANRVVGESAEERKKRSKGRLLRLCDKVEDEVICRELMKLV